MKEITNIDISNPLLRHHHLNEFFVIDLAISVNISFTNHLINLLIGELLTQVGHNVTKFGGGNETVAVLVEHLEGFQDFFFRISILHLARHHRQKLREINRSATIRVDLEKNAS